MADGYVHPDFASVAKLIDRYTGDGSKRFGGALAVYHRGEKVVDIWGGAINAAGDPWQEDTMSMSFSTTKGVASTAVHMCVDRGLIDYDAPVATYWPDFAAAGKDAVTVRQVLTHSAGLHRLRGLLDDVDDVLDWTAMTKLLASRPSDPPAGTGPGYHAFTYGWLAGELVRQVTGQSLGTFVRTEMAEPLGLDGLNIGVAATDLGRVASLAPVPTAEDRARMEKVIPRMERIKFLRGLVEAMLVDDLDALLYDEWQAFVQAEVPAVNGTFTARSLAKLYGALANGGELDGVRLMSPETVAAASARQPAADKRDYNININMQWRLGYHQAFLLGRKATQGFGHFGYGGSGAWADPEHDLAVAFVTNDMSRSTTPFAGVIFAHMSGRARKAARKR